MFWRKKPKSICTFDCDGVIYINNDIGGVYPGPNDVIITGRSYEEQPETAAMLRRRGIKNRVYYNPLPFLEKNRLSSGEHKANTINKLQADGVKVLCHFEDDELQAAVIRACCPGLPVVMLVHDMTEKEIVRHLETL